MFGRKNERWVRWRSNVPPINVLQPYQVILFFFSQLHIEKRKNIAKLSFYEHSPNNTTAGWSSGVTRLWLATFLTKGTTVFHNSFSGTNKSDCRTVAIFTNCIIPTASEAAVLLSLLPPTVTTLHIAAEFQERNLNMMPRNFTKIY